jgi:hypothetical protein
VRKYTQATPIAIEAMIAPAAASIVPRLRGRAGIGMNRDVQRRHWL